MVEYMAQEEYMIWMEELLKRIAELENRNAILVRQVDEYSADKKTDAQRDYKEEEERMKLHVEYDDFGEYVESVIDGELVAVKDCESDRRTVELILFEGTGAA